MGLLERVSHDAHVARIWFDAPPGWGPSDDDGAAWGPAEPNAEPGSISISVSPRLGICDLADELGPIHRIDVHEGAHAFFLDLRDSQRCLLVVHGRDADVVVTVTSESRSLVEDVVQAITFDVG